MWKGVGIIGGREKGSIRKLASEARNQEVFLIGKC